MLIFQTPEELGIDGRIKEEDLGDITYYACETGEYDPVTGQPELYENLDLCMVQLFMLERIWDQKIEKELDAYRAAHPPVDPAWVDTIMQRLEWVPIPIAEDAELGYFYLKYTDSDGEAVSFSGSSPEEIREQVIRHEETKEVPELREYRALQRRHPVEWYEWGTEKKHSLYGTTIAFGEGLEHPVTGQTLEEVAVRAEMENERIRMEQGVFPIADDFSGGWDQSVTRFARAAAMELSALETRNLMTLYEIAVFGSALDRKAARERIYTLLHLEHWKTDMDRREQQMQLYQKLSEPDRKFDAKRFRGYLLDFLHVRKVMNQKQFGENVGLSGSQVSRYVNGTQKHPSKDLVLRMAITMELEKDSFLEFLNAAGYTFPRNEVDYVIWDCLKAGVHDFDSIREALYDHPETRDFVDEKEWKLE